jgi:hypothetical protein
MFTFWLVFEIQSFHQSSNLMFVVSFWSQVVTVSWLCFQLLKEVVYLSESMSFLKRGWLRKGCQVGSSLSKGIEYGPGTGFVRSL